MKWVLAAALMAPGCAAAQQIDTKQTAVVLQSGTVISAGPLLDYTPNSLAPNPIPRETRTHEAFILHSGNVYLCYLTGSPQAGTPPYATCFGRAD